MISFRILLAEDHPVFRIGLCSLIRSKAGWEVCGETADGREAVTKCLQLRPDLLILDICMPSLNGLDAARQILKRNPNQKILVLTNVESEQVIRGCLEAGVRGWILKSDSTDELIAAIEQLQQNRSSFSARISNLILYGYLKPHSDNQTVTIPAVMSSRERGGVQMGGGGKNFKEKYPITGVGGKNTDSPPPHGQ